MHVLIYVPLLVPVLAAVCARPLAERLPPRTATWLLTVSAVALGAGSGGARGLLATGGARAAASAAALGLLAMAAAMRLPVIDSLGGMSLAAVLRLDPAPLPLGVIAGAFFLTAALAAVRAAWLGTAALI